MDEDLCYRAVRSRDPRFDGRFFTGVVSTGVYCRPICPARTPLRRNARFFACAAAAEEAGFRACRRCRPESAPGTPCWDGASATVSRALRLIERGGLDEDGVETLASRLGVGDRYLRRLFARHLGTSPQAVAASRRAHLARTLIDATALPMTDVALESGFGSVRQFNEVIRAVFGRTPSELRRARRAGGATTLLRLSFRPPLDWERLLAFLAARAIPGVEEVTQSSYRRTLAPAGSLEVRLAGDGRALVVRVRRAGPERLLEIARRMRRMFDLDADPLAIAASLGDHPLLARSVAAHPGLRVPGAWDGFETVVRAILGQQISVAAATTLSGRLVRRYGAAVGEGAYLFPTPEALAGADVESIGLPRARAGSVRAIAAARMREPSLFEPAPSLEQLVERLCALPGVGPWTAHYVAMRVFNEPDAFPSGDLGLRRAAGGVSAARLLSLSAPWRPWRAYAAMHLWTQLSEEARHVDRALAS